MDCKDRKGFTLIELLAVIVILAVIALIATPIIVGVISKAKKNSFMDTAYGVVEAGKLYYAKNFGNDDFAGKTFAFPADSEKLKLSGEKPGGGTIEVTGTGKQVLAIYDRAKNWCASKGAEDSKVTVEKYEEGKCKAESTPEGFLPSELTKGTAVYINPETKSACNKEDAVSMTGTKTGCMKWYVYKDNGNGTYQLILDHNTTTVVAWSSGVNSKDGMKEVQVAIENDVQSWNVSLKARLITADEIASITENILFKGSTSKITEWFYLDSNTQTKPATSEGSSMYAWLFDYTQNCTNYGCNVEYNPTIGYWTSTPSFGSTDQVWVVTNFGQLSRGDISRNNWFGVRPVITV